jgi:hypothetical protein
MTADLRAHELVLSLEPESMPEFSKVFAEELASGQPGGAVDVSCTVCTHIALSQVVELSCMRDA